MKSRALDVVLVVLIAASASFIGYRFLRGRNAQLPLLDSGSRKLDIANGGEASVPSVVPGIRDKLELGPAGIAAILLKAKSFSAPEWSALKSKFPLGKFSVGETSACKRSDSNPMAGVPILNAEYLESFKSGKVQFFIDPYGRACIRKNMTVPLYSLGRQPTDLALSLHGDMVIEDIIQFPLNDASAEILEPIVDLPPARIAASLAEAGGQGGGQISLLRISRASLAAGEKKKPALPIPALIRGTTLHPYRVKQYIKLHPDVIVVDVRSKEESVRQPIEYREVISVPYKVSQEPPGWNFNWERTVADVSRDSFEVSEVVQLRNRSPQRPIMFLGAAPFDGRPVWALFELTRIQVGNLVWFYEGVEAFNTAVREN